MFSTGFGSSMVAHPNFKGDHLKMLVVLKSLSHLFWKWFSIGFFAVQILLA
jgi:hypothetical protein